MAKLQSSQHGPFQGVDASPGAFYQPKGTVPRASNLIGIARGALCTCDGSSIQAWQAPDGINGAIGVGDYRFMAVEVFQPSGVSPYYLALKQTDTVQLGSPFGPGLTLLSTTPPPPTGTTITATAGSGQNAIINTDFATQLSVTVMNAGNPVNGATVTFTAPVFGASGTFGGFTTVATPMTNNLGVATAPVFTANSALGTYTVTASVAGVSIPASFTLTNVASTGGPTITVMAGSGQSATVSTVFATALQVLVLDALSNPMNAVAVTFTAPTTGQSGTFAGATNTVTVNTIASGVATAPAFTANATPGTYSVTATSGVTGPATFTLDNIPAGTTGCPGAPTAPATVTTLAPSGGDDTSAFQSALNSTASVGHALQLTAGTFHINSVTIPGGTYLIVASGVTVTDQSAMPAGVAMLNVSGNNVTIVGAGASSSVFQMPLSNAASNSDHNEDRHCLRYTGASASSYINNMYVSGCSFNQSGGDGSYSYYSSNVTFVNCTFDRNFRQGSSVVGHNDHIHFCGCTFSHSSFWNNQAGNGFDCEPNTPTDYLNDITFTDCIFTGNSRDGIDFSLQNVTSAAPTPIAITVLRGHSSFNGRYGYVGNNADPAINCPGAILVQDSFSDNEASAGAAGRFYAANGASLTFQNLTVTNPHRLGPDPSYGTSAAVLIIRGGGASVPQGNVHYAGTNISVTNGKVDYYFDFNDGSGIGTTNETFDATGSLSGATKPNGFNGLIQGVGHNTAP